MTWLPATSQPWRRWTLLSIAALAALGAVWLVISGLPVLRANLAHPWIRQCMAQRVAGSASSFFLPPVHVPPGRFCLSAPSTDTSVRNAPEGGRAFAEVRDLTRIEVWDSEAKRYHMLTGHTGRVRCFALSGSWLLTASDDVRDTPARLWSLETGALVRTFDGGQPACWGGFGFMGFSLDGRRVVAATVDMAVHIWDTASGASLGHFEPGDGVTQFAFSPDGNTLALGTFSGEIALWDWRAKTLLRHWHAHDRLGSAASAGGGVEALAFSTDGRRLRSFGALDGVDAWREWDVATGMPVAK